MRLENVASYQIQPSPGEIRRVNGKMTIAYEARVDARDTFAVRERMSLEFRCRCFFGSSVVEIRINCYRLQ